MYTKFKIFCLPLNLTTNNNYYCPRAENPKINESSITKSLLMSETLPSNVQLSVLSHLLSSVIPILLNK